VIWRYDDHEALSTAVAGLFVQQARNAMQDKGWFGVALSGGHTAGFLSCFAPFRPDLFGVG
jgi:6-phosphogluconolactonase/glucosamine-6-phosphate isomerase/deaminase